MDYLDVSDPERATLPRFQDIHEEYSKDLGSSVHFPQFNLRAQAHRGKKALAESHLLLCCKSLKCVKKILNLSLAIHLPAEPTPPAPQSETDPPLEEEHTVSDRRRRHLEPAAPLPVAVVIVYKSLGKLLPERYDPDRRSLRYKVQVSAY